MTFVDAPFAPRQIDIFYSRQEDATVVRWRLAASEDDAAVSYELADATGQWRAIDFHASLFPGGVAPCGSGGGLCAQMVLPGHYEPPSNGATPVRSRNPTYGISPGNSPLIQTYSKTLVLKSYFARANRAIAAKIDDLVGGDPVFIFPRPLERSVWERGGVCVPGFYPADAQFVPLEGLQSPWPSPAPLSATGRYCAGVRTLPHDASGGIDDQIALDTVPDVTEGRRTYTVPTEETPFTYQIVLDLSIPVPDRCPEAVESIQSLVSGTLGFHSALRPLPTIDLSAGLDPETGMPGSPCRQSPKRALDAAGVAQQVKDAAATWPEQHQRYFLLYFNNLRAPLPQSLTQSLYDFTSTLVTPPPLQEFQAALWPFGPPEMSQSFGGWGGLNTVWSSASDPQFVQDLDDFGSQNLPLISEVQDPLAPVSLLPDGDAQRFDGHWLRLCTASITPLQPGLSPGVEMVAHNADGDLVILPYATEYPVHGADPPAYLMNVPPVWAVPKKGFTAHEAHIRYEICTRYCDHPFTSESEMPVARGWIGSSLCVGPADGDGGGG